MTTQTEIVADSKPSAFATLVAIFTEPAKAFTTIERRSMVWLPLSLVILASAILLAWYYQTVDFAWLQDKLTANLNNPAAQEQAKRMMGRTFLTTTSVISVVVAVPLLYAISAIYYLIVAKINKLEFGFGKWFAFAAWASVPTLLTLPLGALQIVLTSNGQLEPGQLNPVSLNSLFFHLGTGQHWASLLDSISLITIWTFVLSVIGFQQWSKSSRATSIVVVAIPYLLIYGIWAAFSFFSGK